MGLLYLMSLYLLNFPNMCNRVIITVLIASSPNSDICKLWVSFNWLITVLIIDHIFLLFCMPGNFGFDARHKFDLVECWIF